MGRLAMRLIAAWTEGPAFTLTGAEVGEVTLDGTLSLMLSTAQGGAFLGVFYALVRSALPPAHGPVAFAALSLLLPGGVFLGDDEFDLFEPSLVGAALILPVFAVTGLALALLVERVDPRPSRDWTRNGRILLAALAALGLAALLRNLVALA